MGSDLPGRGAIGIRRAVLREASSWPANTGLSELVFGEKGKTRATGMLARPHRRRWQLAPLTCPPGPLSTRRASGGVRSTPTGTGFTGSLRADATGLPVSEAPAGEPFNFAAFTLPPAGQFGNAGRNTITGPTQFGLNASLGRVFRIGDRKNIDLRFDATNALNHVTFRNFNTTIGSNNLGLLAGPSNMRSMTATLRFRF